MQVEVPASLTAATRLALTFMVAATIGAA